MRRYFPALYSLALLQASQAGQLSWATAIDRALIAGLASISIKVLIRLLRGKSPRGGLERLLSGAKSGDWLDDALFLYPDNTPYSVRDSLRGTEVKGVTGSGKTSGVIYFWLDKILAHPRATICAWTQKPEEAGEIAAILARHGKKYKIIGAGGEYRCGFIQDELESGADTAALTEFCTLLGQGLKEKSGNHQHPFYDSFERRILFNAIAVLSLGGELSFPNLHAFISDAVCPTSADPTQAAALRARWQKGYHFRTLGAAQQAPKTAAQKHDWNVAAPFWALEWPQADKETRGNGLAGVNNLLQAACTGLGMELASRYSNASPRDIDEGWSLIFDFPASEGPTNRFLGGGWKYKVQKHVLRRDWDRRYFNIFLLDEFQEAKSDFDPRYLAQSRSHGGSLICATQTVHAEYGSENKHKADMLMANFYTHVYCQSDPDTEAAALNKLGQRLETFVSPTLGGNQDLYDVLAGDARPSVNVSHQWQPVLHAGCLNNLRTGGPNNRNCVDALVIQGEPFRNGDRHQFMTFNQRPR